MFEANLSIVVPFSLLSIQHTWTILSVFSIYFLSVFVSSHLCLTRRLIMNLCVQCLTCPLFTKGAYVNFLYKVVNSYYDCTVLLSNVCFSVHARRLRSSALFRAGRSRINVRKYSPLLRCMASYNDILDSNCKVDLFSSIHSFKDEVRNTLYDLLICHSCVSY
jgi:hypothetical protein